MAKATFLEISNIEELKTIKNYSLETKQSVSGIWKKINKEISGLITHEENGFRLVYVDGCAFIQPAIYQ